MQDMEKDTVDFVPNYDERLHRADASSRAPSRTSSSMAARASRSAWPPNMPPHNLGEVVDARLRADRQSGRSPCAELMAHIKGPDFPTGCIIHGTTGIRDYIETGHGIGAHSRQGGDRRESRQPRADHHHRDPYNVNRADAGEAHRRCSRTRRSSPTSAASATSPTRTPASSSSSRSDAAPRSCMNNLYKHTALESASASHMLAIDRGQPDACFSMKDAIACYIEHRREVIIRRTQLPARQGRSARPKARSLPPRPRPPRRLHQDHPRQQEPRRSPRRTQAPTTFSDRRPPKGSASCIRSQPSIQIGDYVLHRQAGRRHPRTPPLPAHRAGARQGEGRIRRRPRRRSTTSWTSSPASTACSPSSRTSCTPSRPSTRTPRLARIEAELEGEIDSIDLIPNEATIVTMTHLGSIKRTLHRRVPPARPRRQRLERHGDARGARATRTRTTSSSTSSARSCTTSCCSSPTRAACTSSACIRLPRGPRTGKGRSIKNVLNLRPEEKIASVLILEGAGCRGRGHVGGGQATSSSPPRTAR